METAEIHRRFLGYFSERGHPVVPSASLLLDDPNLLFISAGMVQFVPFYLGQQTPPYSRATSVQKCIRTTDIDEVGKTTRHGTFFQMCGNFSFGDYFKEDAMRYAWELVTRSQADGGLGFDESRLWVTIYRDDDESAALWTEKIGVSPERIVRLGMADNYWSMGVAGPCGPDSEIFFDRGPEYGPDGGPGVGADDRFLEIWNLVFMDAIRADGGDKDNVPVIGELPQKNIDTGMGLERVAYLLQGVDNLYEIDEVYPVIDRAAELAGRRYGAGHIDDVRFRIIGDHVRAALMLVGDGIVPSNEAHGYVLRRLIRRAVRAMRLLGVDAPTMPELLPVSLGRMRDSYPELARDWGRISQTVYGEEEAFRETLRTGTQIFDLAARETKSARSSVLPGAKAFQLHDTFGFPIDLTLEMAAEQGLSVDEDGFRSLMTEQQQRAKAAARAKKTGHADLSAYRSLSDSLGSPVLFTGYDEVVSDGRVAGLLVHGMPAAAAREGDEIEIVLDRTPFYAEAGGQLADHGTIECENGARIEVLDVQKPIGGLTVHRARVLSGQVTAGLAAQGAIDVDRRRAISRAHTATHMVHKTVRELLGETATQAGSENSPGRLRFDFHSTVPLDADRLAEAEQRLNDVSLEDLPVTAQVMNISDARAMGAMALFGQKYGDEVRVVSLGDWAHELCGGTHAGRLGHVGVVKVVGESSVAAGVRRVEALVGADAYRYLNREHLLLDEVTRALQVNRAEDVPGRLAALVDRLKTAEKELEQARMERLASEAGRLAATPKDVFGVGFVGYRAPDGAEAGDLRKLALDICGRLPAERPGVVTVLGSAKGKASVVVAVNDAARRWRLAAGDLVKVAATVLGGSGGGKDDIAQGGGTDPNRAEEAISRVEHTVGTRVTSA